MSDPAPEGTSAARRESARSSGSHSSVVVGVLSLLVTVALLVPVPVTAGWVDVVVVAVLVLALATLALVGTHPEWRATVLGQVLWFWGVVTGLGHLLRALVADPTGVESAAIGAAVTLVWALCLALLRRGRRG